MQVRSAFLVGLFFIVGMATIWYAMARFSGSRTISHDEGVLEVE